MCKNAQNRAKISKNVQNKQKKRQKSFKNHVQNTKKLHIWEKLAHDAAIFVHL